MADQTGADRPGSGKPRCCPFFWTGRPPAGDGPAYLVQYPQRFICRGGRHSSLLTYEELLSCIEKNGDSCPSARATA